jgi:hypothetical protein
MDDRVESAVLLSLIGGGLIVCALGAREPSYRKNYGLAFKKFGQLGDVQSNPSRMLHRLPGRSIRTDVADIALPPPICHLSHASETPARIFSALIPGGNARLEKSTVCGS